MVNPLSFDALHAETHTLNPTNLESVWWLNRRSHDLHLGHILRVSAKPTDEQYWTGVLDVLKKDQFQMFVYLKAGIRYLEVYILISGAVIELD